MKELGNTPADKNYKPSGISKAKERALEAYPNLDPPTFDETYPRILFTRNTERNAYIEGYEQAEKDILSLIEFRISEIIGDAQPKPALRAELEELIKQIKND